jgi:transposase-like protein
MSLNRRIIKLTEDIFEPMKASELKDVEDKFDRDWAERARRYVANPDHCPYCKSKNIHSGQGHRLCKNCDREWTEILGPVWIREYP